MENKQNSTSGDTKDEEEDFEKIFEKFKFICDNPDFFEIAEKFLITNELENANDLKQIMKRLTEVLILSEINLSLDKVIKNEKFIDFIHDLFFKNSKSS